MSELESLLQMLLKKSFIQKIKEEWEFLFEVKACFLPELVFWKKKEKKTTKN